MIAVEDTQLALNLQLLDARNNLSPDDLMSYFTATESMALEGKKVKEMNRVVGSQSLALKAKVAHSEDNYEDSDEELEMTSTSDLRTDISFFAKKWNRNFKKGFVYAYLAGGAQGYCAKQVFSYF